MIDGVYAMVPYISGAYGWSEADRIRELPSLIENDSYDMRINTPCGIQVRWCSHDSADQGRLKTLG